MKKIFKKQLPIILGLAMLVAFATAAFSDDKPATAPAMGGATIAAPAAPAATQAPATTPAPAANTAASEPVGDPSGVNTGVAADAVGEAPNSPTADDLAKLGKNEPLALKLADSVGHNRIAINFVWTLLCGYLVMFMQVGFAMLETGLTRAKNASHTMAMNLIVYATGMLGYWVCGYAIQMGGLGGVASLGAGTGVLNHEFILHMFGHDFGLFGMKGFFLQGVSYDAGIFVLFLFQMVFMDTAATIPTGSMSERWKFKSFVPYGIFMGAFLYPMYANWVWGGGWLAMLGKNFGLGHGHVDFAGSSVVHMTGGVAALVGAWVLGPRIGKFNKDGSPNAIPGHHIPMAVIGTLILAFGWFGFNPGSTLAGCDLRIGIIAGNTMLASAAGTFTSMLYMWYRFGKPDITMACNGLLAGLVAITAPCAFVTAPVAVLIGGIAGVLVCWAVFFVERTLKIDDPVGAFAVHGVNGAWGVLSLGLFADGKYGDGFNGVAGTVTGLFYGAPSQFLAECIGVVTNVVFVGVVSFILFKVLDIIIGNRVSAEVEEAGLDDNEVSVLAYPDFSVRKMPLGGHRSSE